MFILISHRGNINSINPLLENTSQYIDVALNKSYLCEVDVWRIDNKLYLSHDKPSNQSTIEEKYLLERKEHIIIHCKNIEALQHFHSSDDSFHYFWHQNDDYTLTSKGWIWAYPDKPVNMMGLTVAVMPELHNTDVSNFAAICSDFVETYR